MKKGIIFSLILGFSSITILNGLTTVSFESLSKEIQIVEINPFVQEGVAVPSYGHVTYHFWQTAFWMDGEALQNKAQLDFEFSNKQDRLIKFSNDGDFISVYGISESKVIEAFGEPVEIVREDDLFIWAYHPWKRHSRWTIMVYIKEGVLVGIGEVHPIADGEEVDIVTAVLIDEGNAKYLYEVTTGIVGISSKEEMIEKLESGDYREEDLITEERYRGPLGIVDTDSGFISLLNTSCNLSPESSGWSGRCQDQYNNEIFLGTTYQILGLKYIDKESSNTVILPTELMLVTE